MPIEIRCPKCERRLSVPDKYAGKRVKCPNCQGPIGVPAPGGQAPTAKSAPKTPVRETKPAKTKAVAKAPAAESEGGWYLQTEEGEQYGPATKKELDAWVAEERIDASCQLLQEGWQQWKWAEDVYPQLAQSPAASEPAPAGRPVVPPLPGQQAPQVGPLFPQQAAGSIAAQRAQGRAVSGATAGTPNMRRTLADCLRPLLIFVAIMLFLQGTVASYWLIYGLWMLLKAMSSRFYQANWGGTVGLLLMFVMLAAVVAYIVAGFFLLRFQQRMDVFLRREAGRELNRAMQAYRMFWLLMYIATFTLVGVVLTFYLIGLTVSE